MLLLVNRHEARRYGPVAGPDDDSISLPTESTPLLAHNTMHKINILAQNEKPSPPPPPASPAPPASTSHTRNTTEASINTPTLAPSASSIPSPSPTPSPPNKLSKRLARRAQRYSPCLTLENQGSVARDHLASERTFLAYVRTSLAIAATGVALVQLFTISASSNIQRFARPLGATTVALGLLVLIIGLARFFAIQSALTRGQFPVARAAVGAIAAPLGVLVLVAFALLVGVRP